MYKHNLTLLGLLMGLLITLPNGQAVQAAQCDVNSVAVGGAGFDAPGAMVATLDGKWLLAVDEIGGNLKVVSTTEQKVVTMVSLQGVEPTALTMSPDGTRLFVAGTFNTGIAVLDISAAEPAQWKVIGIWPVSGDFTALLFDHTTPRLLVADRNARGVRVLSNTDGSELATLAVPNGRCSLPSDLAVKGTQLFVACEMENIVAVFDLSTQAHLKNIGVGNAPTALSAHPSENRVFVANVKGESLSIINTSNLDELPQTISDASLLTAPKAMAWLGGELWILDQAQSKLVRYTDKLEASVCMGLGNRPTHLVAFSGGLLYIANSLGLNYVQVDTVNRKVKTFPQLLMAGFDPMFIDDADDQVRVLAVVEEGLNPVGDVGYLMNGSGLTINNMDLVGVILLDAATKRYGLVYQQKLSFEPRALPHGPVAQMLGIPSAPSSCNDDNCHYSLFGGYRGQFTVSVRDSFNQAHHYPGWQYMYDKWLPSEVPTPGMAVTQPNYAYQGPRRALPQVIMAGFSPMLMHKSEAEIKVMAVVRVGSSPIQAVTLNNLTDKKVVTELNKVADLPNGDQLYQGVAFKKPGTDPLFPGDIEYSRVWNDLFTVIVRDQNNGEHRFPNVKVGHFPAQ
ncbi:MAG: hypothetical protein DRR19_27655 [Candidatus Parabeggiatoa sp. nov. 1]|nr:MAG: hypothetical protein DRR19_27655 [Gammaproteobacteria bacterium]